MRSPRSRLRLQLGMLAGALGLALASALHAAPGEPFSPPNILVILTDDMGTQLGTHGDVHATTPHIDQLAAQGVRFDRAYAAAPSCTPSRAALLTGVTPHANGQWGFGAQTELHPGIVTAPEMMRQAGYFTGLLGKNHIRAADGQLEFDVRVEIPKSLHNSPQAIGRAVNEFLDKTGGQPFFLVVGIRAPHTPYPGDLGVPAWREPHDPDAIPVPATALDTPRFRQAQARMYDAYSLADDLVGSILTALEGADLSRSTLVIVTSDHGPAIPASKGTLFEGGIHVPLIAHWPGVTAPGRSTDALVGGVDLLPTLLEIAGAPSHPQIQGKSFAKILKGEPAPSPEVVFSEQTLLQGNRYFPQRAVRADRYKYIRTLRPDIELRNHALGRWAPEMIRAWNSDPRARFLLERQVRPGHEELYDLQADPDELHNLAADPAHAKQRVALRKQLFDWMKRTRDPWLGIWEWDGTGSDPHEPAIAQGSPFQRTWLDAALAAEQRKP
ncbi:sulfatase [Myxococcota bacterium]|nr:sulfatase [Myxococcota bacterium]